MPRRAAVLALCLLLTGCYQPPDEVNNGGGSQGGVTAPLFETMAPTATVTVTIFAFSARRRHAGRRFPSAP